MKRYLLILLAVFLCGITLQAQNITDVKAYQSGKNIIITYHLDKQTNIKVQVSTDKGKTYSKPLKKVSGDVGDAVQPGNNRIVWEVLSENENYDGKIMSFKVVPVPVKAKFQHEVSAHSGWMGATSTGVYTSVVPTSLEYLAGVRLNHIFIGAGLDFNLNNLIVKAKYDESKLNKNMFSLDLKACLRYYILKDAAKVNPYLSANLIYGFVGNFSYSKENPVYDVQGWIRTGGLMWSASAGASVRIAPKCSCTFSLGLRSFNLEYGYKATGTPPFNTTRKESQSMLLIPVASVGFTF